MSRLSGNFDASNMGQIQRGAGPNAGAKIKDFFVGIGKGFARAGKAIAHFFGSSVPSFFKALGQRTAAPVATNATPRSGPTADINNLDFSTAQDFDAHDSGNGGVAFAKVGGATVVIKGADTMSANEVLGARLAREVGLSAPETRMLTQSEITQVNTQLRHEGTSMPKRRMGDSGPTIVMEHVQGKEFGNAKITSKQQMKQLAQSMAKWVAFDVVISEQDRFANIKSDGYTAMRGVNTANFMINPSNPNEIIGIDQSVTGADTSGAMHKIISGERDFFRDIGDTICGKFRELGMDGEDLADDMMTAAQDMLKHIGATLTDVKIAQLSGDLPIMPKVMDSLAERLETAANYSTT